MRVQWSIHTLLGIGNPKSSSLHGGHGINTHFCSIDGKWMVCHFEIKKNILNDSPIPSQLVTIIVCNCTKTDNMNQTEWNNFIMLHCARPITWHDCLEACELCQNRTSYHTSNAPNGTEPTMNQLDNFRFSVNCLNGCASCASSVFVGNWQHTHILDGGKMRHKSSFAWENVFHSL